MNHTCEKMRNCLSQVMRERGFELAHYRGAREHDKFLGALMETDAEDPKQIAALALCVLCEGTSISLDVVAILGCVQFLKETCVQRNDDELQDPLSNMTPELIDLIPTGRAEFIAWIDKWFR